MIEKIRVIMVTIVLLFTMITPVWAEENISLNANQSISIQVEPLQKVAVANPDIADVVVISNQEVLIVAKKQGNTSLQVWNENGGMQSYSITVDGNDYVTANMIKNILAYPNVRIAKAGGKIILEGKVNDQYEKKRAEQIAGLYSDKVVNLLEMTAPKQVRIETKVIEISTDKLRKLGLKFSNSSGIDKDKGTVSLGTEGSFGLGQTFSNSKDGSNTFGWFGSYADLNATLVALMKTGDAKVLSQPSVVTLSGEKAHILVGGEIPVPMSNKDNEISIEWHEYGIKLDIAPEVSSDDRITGKVEAEVSSLDTTSSAAVTTSDGSISIPALTTRKANVVVNMLSGNTMAIGGLISSDESKQINKIPFLGDLPILGKFFRNTVKSKERKEVIILVTPTLVDDHYMPKLSSEMEKFIKNQEKGAEDDGAANKK